jgi:tetratricopeptide (TPR) repeat protein
MQSLGDFDKVISLDSTNSLTYFNRAILRSRIGDYNRALEDYDKVAHYSPENVLVYYNRAILYTQLGELESAIEDYSKAIELYPDFANAYLNRSTLRYALRDAKGGKSDHDIAQRKIAEYKSRLSDSTYSIYADTTRRFDRLLSFDTKLSGSNFNRITSRHDESEDNLALLPLFRFTLIAADSTAKELPTLRHQSQRVTDFIASLENPLLKLSRKECNLPADSLVIIEQHAEKALRQEVTNSHKWKTLFAYGVTQSLIKQYTAAVNTFTAAINENPTNPFLYLNRSTTRAEMIDFISSIDNSYQRITIDSDPASRLKNNSTRTYNYDEAIADLNKALKLYPDFAVALYNRANLHAISGDLPEAYEDYTRAIELNPYFAEAYYNRGLIQIFMKDTRKGCLDISKAGELGVEEAYEVLKEYTQQQ